MNWYLFAGQEIYKYFLFLRYFDQISLIFQEFEMKNKILQVKYFSVFLLADWALSDLLKHVSRADLLLSTSKWRPIWNLSVVKNCQTDTKIYLFTWVQNWNDVINIICWLLWIYETYYVSWILSLWNFSVNIPIAGLSCRNSPPRWPDFEFWTAAVVLNFKTKIAIHYCTSAEGISEWSHRIKY